MWKPSDNTLDTRRGSDVFRPRSCKKGVFICLAEVWLIHRDHRSAGIDALAGADQALIASRSGRTPKIWIILFML